MRKREKETHLVESVSLVVEAELEELLCPVDVVRVVVSSIEEEAEVVVLVPREVVEVEVSLAVVETASLEVEEDVEVGRPIGGKVTAAEDVVVVLYGKCVSEGARRAR